MIESVEIEEIENYLSYIRPPVEMRPEYDISYRIKNQSVIIHEIRPHWQDPEKKLYPLIAKATYVKKHDHWKVFWQPGDLKWHSYRPQPIVPHLLNFIRLIENDAHGCFWG